MKVLLCTKKRRSDFGLCRCVDFVLYICRNVNQSGSADNSLDNRGSERVNLNNNNRSLSERSVSFAVYVLACILQDQFGSLCSRRIGVDGEAKISVPTKGKCKRIRVAFCENSENAVVLLLGTMI